MTDFKSKDYFELKAIIRKENERAGEQVLSPKGKKADLIARLES